LLDLFDKYSPANIENKIAGNSEAAKFMGWVLMDWCGRSKSFS